MSQVVHSAWYMKHPACYMLHVTKHKLLAGHCEWHMVHITCYKVTHCACYMLHVACCISEGPFKIDVCLVDFSNTLPQQHCQVVHAQHLFRGAPAGECVHQLRNFWDLQAKKSLPFFSHHKEVTVQQETCSQILMCSFDTFGQPPNQIVCPMHRFLCSAQSMKCQQNTD